MILLQTIALICSLNMPADRQLYCQKYYIKCVDRLVEDHKVAKLTEKDALKICINVAKNFNE